MNIKKYVGVIRNFLNYLLYHEVCPENRAQIEASQQVCDQAYSEWCQIAQLKPLLPGSFNTACSAFFGGTFRDWQPPTENDWLDPQDRQLFTMGMTIEHARDIFRIGLAAQATDRQLGKYRAERQDQDFKITRHEMIRLEVSRIILGRSNPDIVEFYNNEKSAKDLPILGNFFATTWLGPGGLEEDLTEEEEAEHIANPKPTEEFQFWMEDEILEHMFIGLKFEASVKQMSFGIQYFDAVNEMHPSFLTILPNEAMIGWREIEAVWLPPRPTVGSNEQDLEDEGDEEDASIADGN